MLFSSEVWCVIGIGLYDLHKELGLINTVSNHCSLARLGI